MTYQFRVLCFSIKLVRPAISKHRAKQIGALLIRRFVDTRPHTWLHPNDSQIGQIPLAPRAPSIHGPSVWTGRACSVFTPPRMVSARSVPAQIARSYAVSVSMISRL